MAEAEVDFKMNRWCNVQCAPQECGRLWVGAMIGSKPKTITLVFAAFSTINYTTSRSKNKDWYTRNHCFLH